MLLVQILVFILIFQLLSLIPLAMKFLFALVFNLKIDEVWFCLGKKKAFIGPLQIVFNLGIIPLGSGIKLMEINENSVLNKKPLTRKQKLPLYIAFESILIISMQLIALLGFSLSFYIQGERVRTLQVTNLQSNDAYANQLGILRGDILLAIDKQKIVDFDLGLERLKDLQNPAKKLTFERKTGFQKFSSLAKFSDYLENNYQDGAYISFKKAGEEERLFYAKNEALKQLENLNLEGFIFSVSTDKIEYTTTWDHEQSETLGIGIKPYTLDAFAKPYSIFDSLRLGFSYCLSISKLTFLAILNFLVNGFSWLTSFSDLFNDLTLFVADVSDMDLLVKVRTIAIISILFAILNILPLPGLALWSILRHIVYYFKSAPN